MLLQPTISKSPPLHLSLSATHFYSLSFPSGHGNSTPIRTLKTPKKNQPIIKCSISQVSSSGPVDYKKRPGVKWGAIYKRISLMKDPEKGAGSVLNQWENEGKTFTKWDLSRVIKELRKFKLYKYALQVYEWMNNRGERFRITSSDTAIQLDLIAKVHGIPSAEDYFLRVPNSSKDKRIYGALLNTYVRTKMTEKAESLFTQMRDKGYANHALHFNVMMTLYMKLKDYDKVETVVSEMMEKQIPLDVYSYNIWLSSCGSQGSVEKMEQVYQQMKLDSSINPNWTTFSTMATMYIRMGQIKKAQECLKELEGRITGRDRTPYHYLINLHGMVGNKEEVYRVWNIYKGVFTYITNFGYYTVVSALVRLEDIQGAEIMYEEWLLVKLSYEPRIPNALMHWYIRNGFVGKAEALFDKVIEMGGKPTSIMFEILAVGHIQEGRISKALSCLNDAVLARRSQLWKPKPAVVSAILEICKQEDDTASKEVLLGLLRRAGCLEDEAYMSYISLSNGMVNGKSLMEERTDDDHDDGDEMIFNQ